MSEQLALTNETTLQQKIAERDRLQAEQSKLVKRIIELNVEIYSHKTARRFK